MNEAGKNTNAVGSELNEGLGVWSLIFSVDGCTEAHVFRTSEDPEQVAIEIVSRYPFLRLIAAIEGNPRIRLMDNARTADCGLQD